MKNIIDMLLKKYDFRFNVIQGRAEYKEKSNSEFKLLTERIANSILIDLKSNGITTSQNELQIILNSELVAQFNPITDYFEKLPRWDGENHILNLSQTVKAIDQSYFNWVFKKWFVAMVHCAIDEDIINHCALVLVGDQGCGKTTWIENLIPDNLKPYLVSTTINPSNKDSNLLLSEKILINMDELANFNARQVEAYKELITKSKITERRVYARFSDNYPRRASFAATTNHRNVLTDQSGNRRFLVCEIDSIDYTREINLEQCFAQSLELIDKNFQHYFDREEQNRISLQNENFRQQSSEEELVLEYLSIPNDKTIQSQIRYLNSTEIIAFLKSKVNGYVKLTPITLGKVLTSLGFKTTKKKGLKKYKVILK